MTGSVRTAAAAWVLMTSSAIGPNAAEIPDTLAVAGDVVVLRVQAEGAQIYECKADAGGHLTWQFREPIASLFRDGATIGRHYAGPTWEIGGSTVVGKVVAQRNGASARDIKWLRLDVAAHHGDGPLQDVTAIQRINTKGGVMTGQCAKLGLLNAAPYAADYVFLRKAP
jgi:Protein of unknown function (DUF3455)